MSIYWNYTSFVQISARHGALNCSKGIISLSERNNFPKEKIAPEM